MTGRKRAKAVDQADRRERRSRGRSREKASFLVAPPRSELADGYAETLTAIKGRIGQERLRVVLAANSAMALLHRDIGWLILERQEGAGWGATSPRTSLTMLSLALISVLNVFACSGRAEPRIYCESMSSGGGDPDRGSCDARLSCGTDRDVVMSRGLPPEPRMFSLELSCDGGECTCTAGDLPTRSFSSSAGACEVMASDPDRFVNDLCGWDMERLNTLDPEVQYLDDFFRRVWLIVLVVVVLASLAMVAWAVRSRWPRRGNR